MTAVHRLFLFEQLASPILEEREAAAREIGELILNDDISGFDDVIDWLTAQETESRAVDGLLPLVWIKLRDPSARLPSFDDVEHAIRYPSLLAASLITLLYGRFPQWLVSSMFDPNAAFETRGRDRFGRIIGSMCGLYRHPALPVGWRTAFEDLLIREFSVVDRRLGQPSVGMMRYGQNNDHFIPNYRTLAGEAVVSAFQRAIAAMSTTQAVPIYQWYTAPVAPSLWISPSRADESVSRFAKCSSCSGAETMLNSTANEDFRIGRLHVRTINTSREIVDLRIIGFYQRVVDGFVPEIDYFDVFENPEVIIPYDSMPALPARVVDEWTLASRDWEAVPMTLRVRQEFATLFQTEFMLREPASPFAMSALAPRVTPTRTGIEYLLSEKIIGRTTYWITHRSVEVPEAIPPPAGCATVLNQDFVMETAAALKAVPAYAVRVERWNREHDFGDFRFTSESDVIGATNIARI